MLMLAILLEILVKKLSFLAMVCVELVLYDQFASSTKSVDSRKEYITDLLV